MIDTLFTVTVLELFLGGGGRLTEIGPATLRMVLFAVCIFAGILVFSLRRRADGQLLAGGLVLMYFLVHLPGLVVGALHGAQPSDMLSELQQSLYFLAAPFFALVLQSRSMVERTANLVALAGVILAASYVLVLAGLAMGTLDFEATYIAMNATGEFFFRGESFFFYKGFLYLGLATIFLLAIRGSHWLPLLLLVVSALVMTLTRGFALSTSIAVLLMLAAQGRWRWVGAASIAVAVATFLVWVYLPSLDEAFDGQRDISNSQRYEDLTYIFDNTSVWTILFGEGFGSLINERLNIENTFLWVFWKLGFAGVVFWCIPLAICVYYYVRIPKRHQDFQLASAFFFGTVLIYVQTLTNPYLNNPIGLSFVLLAIFSIRTLSRASASSPPRMSIRRPTLSRDAVIAL